VSLDVGDAEHTCPTDETLPPLGATPHRCYSRPKRHSWVVNLREEQEQAEVEVDRRRNRIVYHGCLGNSFAEGALGIVPSNKYCGMGLSQGGTMN